MYEYKFEKGAIQIIIGINYVIITSKIYFSHIIGK